MTSHSEHRSPGRPTTGKVREARIPDPLWDHVKAEARRRKLSVSAMLRHILTERYEGDEK